MKITYSAMFAIKMSATSSWSKRYTVEHAKFTTSNFGEFEVQGIFTTYNFHVLRTYILWGSCQSFFSWRLLDWLQSYDGIKFGQLSVHWCFKTNINQLLYLYTLRCDHQRCYKLSNSHLEIIQTYFSPQPLKLSTLH